MKPRLMHAVAIGDDYIPCELMAKAIAELQPSRLVTIQWNAKDVSELQARLLKIEREGPDSVPPPEEIWVHLAETEFLMTHLCPISKEMIVRAPHLRYIGVCRGGTDNIDLNALKERPIQLFNAPGRNANAVAEMAVALMLAEARNIGRAHVSMMAGGWRKRYFNDNTPSELRGKVVGLVGFGMIGQKVAALLHGFGVRIIVYDPFLSAEEIEAEAAIKVDFSNLLRHSDFISLHARREPNEPPLVGAKELAQMKSTAYLINTARACLIDEEALAKALKKGQIAGAAVDVFSQEPLPSNSPLRLLDNVTLTPHLAGSTIEAWQNAPKTVVQSLIKSLQ